MSVFVDELQRWPGTPRDPHAQRYFGRGKESCHLFADTLDELHAFAARLGLKREWFQPLSWPHYDLTPKRRTHAVLLGAEERSGRALAIARLAARRAGEEQRA